MSQHPSVFSLIDTLCKKFAASREEGRQFIAEYLKEVPEEARPHLFVRLLPIHIRERKSQGERPLARDYLTLFPQFADEVNAEFTGSTSDEMLDDTSADDEAETQDLPAAIPKLGNYELKRHLGRGRMWAVYEARPVGSGKPVALKTIIGHASGGVGPQQLLAMLAHKLGHNDAHQQIEDAEVSLEKFKQMVRDARGDAWAPMGAGKG